MKLTCTLLFSALFMFMNFTASAVNSTIKKDKDTYELIRDNLTVTEILEFDETAIEDRIGKRLKWKERKGLATAKWKIKRYIKKGYSEEEIENKLAREDFTFSIVGFLLGFFLSLLGILLSWILLGWGSVKSALIGFLVSLLLGGTYFLTR